MSLIQENTKSCLLCCQFFEPRRTLDVDKEDENITTGYSESKELAEQIFVVFLLRNVLQIPKSFCENLLVSRGNPSQWIFCCPTCSDIINNLHTLFIKLTKTGKKYDSLKRKVNIILDKSKEISVNVARGNESIAINQNDTAREIRTLFFSEKENGNRRFSSFIPQENVDIQFKQETDPISEIKAEDILSDSYQQENDFGEASLDDGEKVDISVGNSKLADYSKPVQKKKYSLRSRNDAPSKWNDVEEDYSLSDEVGCTDSGESGGESRDRENISSENSDDENNTQISIPLKIKRRVKSKKSGVTKTRNKDFKSQHSCGECEETFQFVHELVSHALNKHEKKYSCGHCNCHFANRSLAREHHKTVHAKMEPMLRKYYENKDRHCDLCGKFLKVGTIVSHMQTTHKIPKCTICNKICRSIRHLKVHRRGMHYKELNLEPFKCKICEKTFVNPDSVASHMTSQHEHDFRVFCPICNAGIVNKSSLKSHIRVVHNREKPFKCNFCAKSFALKGNLRTHEIGVHTKEFKFNCDICSKGFLSKDIFESHKLTAHSSTPKPFVCELCGNSFTNKILLKCHQRGSHYKELNLKPYQCSECKSTFSGPSGLRQHVVKNHTKDFKFPCSDCGKQFMLKGQLDFHIRVHHSKEPEHLCAVCGKAFFTKKNLRGHIERQHTKEFPFKCTLCPDRGYSDNWRFKRHMKIKHPDLVQDT